MAGMKLLVALGFATSAVAEVREFWWNVTYAKANPDGLFERQVIGVNGTWPPPPIEVNQNDTVLLHTFNGLDQPTSIHHHGMFLRGGHGFYDGAVGVTQCPIPPGASFDYVIPTDEQIGTYWVHGHFSGQYVDGLRAPYIIHNLNESYHYDAEYTVILGDWYHEQHRVLVGQFMSIANPTGAEPVPEAAIMYFSQNGAYLPGFNENATLPFQPGKTYRLRVINTSALAMFWFWVDGHQMRLIEADGVDVQETPVNIQSLSVAQRYSFLITARNDTSANWAIHANMDPEMFDQVPDSLKLNITSVISYGSQGDVQPSSLIEGAYANTIDDYKLVPLQAQAIGAPNQSVPLNALFSTFDNGINRASFENVTWNTPRTPTYFSAATSGQTDPAWYGPSASVLKLDEVVELYVTNGDVGFHPFHLHGHKFAIAWKSFDITSDDPSINPPVPDFTPNPMWRDTVMIPPGGGVRLRFVADNPGAWLFHCHIDWHFTSGLAWVLVESPGSIFSTQLLQPSQTLSSQCTALNYPVSGNAAGNNDSATDYRGWQLGPYPQKLGWHPKGIGAMFACVFTAVLGMGTVVWYTASGMGDL